MAHYDTDRLQRMFAGDEGALTPRAREVLLEVALVFTVDEGRIGNEPFQLVQALAAYLGVARRFDPAQVPRVPPDLIVQKLAGLGLPPEALRAFLRPLLHVGVARGALTGELRGILAGIARTAGVEMPELNDLARTVLQETTPRKQGARVAIVSDIHANAAALQAVLRDVDAQGIERVICLGDVVGYGPDPVECTDLIRSRCERTIMGNHDIALFEGSAGFNAAAAGAIDWTRDELRASGEEARERWQFLKDLPLTYEEPGALYVHGSPRDPWREYIFPDEARMPKARRKFREIFLQIERFLFVGHTHIPCVITHDAFVSSAAKVDNVWTRPDGMRAIVNVGSVGQPRDRDARACYVVLDGDTVTWRRVAYPTHLTVARLEQVGKLDRSLAVRLVKGV